MLKDHPKGLFVAFFANMGERFGFYTMVAIFIMFLQAKYGFDAAKASQIYGLFMGGVYFLPLMGGYIADRFLGYGKTVSLGLIVMFLGYLLLAIPSGMGQGFGFVVGALAVIAFGTGLFKGNLQTLVGNLYDDPKYKDKRDNAFNIFYMGINIGAMFAPTAAEKVSNWILSTFHYTYDARIPALANTFLKGELKDPTQFLSVAQAQDPSVTMESLGTFSEKYITALSQSYHYAFGVACVSLIVSMIIYWTFIKHYRHAMGTEKQKARKAAEAGTKVVELTPSQTKERIVALLLVFAVVIFFWMSFHQNGVCMTYFARDYTQHSVSQAANLWFDVFGLLSVFLSVVGLVFIVRKTSGAKTRIIGALVFIAFGILAYLRYNSYLDVNPITPQKFQQMNPFFIVALTPLVVGFFSWLARKGKEPSAPRKIGIGMLITAVGFLVLVLASRGLTSPKDLHQLVAPDKMLISPMVLISSYFILTIAELFVSPMGISFVTRVAPPKYKGLMMGGWFAATAIGNYLLSAIGYLWGILPLWGLWTVLVVCTLLSATFIFSVMKRLERATVSSS